MYKLGSIIFIATLINASVHAEETMQQQPALPDTGIPGYRAIQDDFLERRFTPTGRFRFP